MTVISDHNRHKYIADGETSDFDFTFTLQSSSHLEVYINDDLQPSNGYAVVIEPSNVGGYVRFATLPAEDDVVILLRNVPKTQETEIPTEANFPEKTITDMSDKAVMMIQDLQEQIDRCIKLPPTTQSDVDLTLPEPEASKVLVFNSAADGLELVDRLESSGTGTGDVTGPNAAAAGDLALFSDTTGKLLKKLTSGTSGLFLKSNGPGSDPSWAAPAGGTANGQWRPANIASSLRALPTSGALSGTYVHFGDWTSANALTFSHDTRIYMNGNFSLGHTMTGTAQSNGGGQTGAGVAGQSGGGPGGGMGGTLPKGGGAGGGGAGAGGAGGGNTTTTGNLGGKAITHWGPGGSGGGSGAGDAGSKQGQPGGGGGPAILFEINGNMTVNENITANGADGTANGTGAGAGAGGGGGQIEARVSGNFTGATGKKMQANGGAGGVGSVAATVTGRRGGGGGGGTVRLTVGGTKTFSGTFALEAAGGAAGATGTQTAATAAAGSAGVTSSSAGVTPVSL